MREYVLKGKVYEIVLDNEKIVKASAEFIKRMMDNLEIDEEDAILTWLEDNEYLINDEQEELNSEAKNYKVNVGATDAAKERKKREVVRKENPAKKMIIEKIAGILPDFAEDIKIENDQKLITFRIGENEFKIDLVQKRNKTK